MTINWEFGDGVPVFHEVIKAAGVRAGFIIGILLNHFEHDKTKVDQWIDCPPERYRDFLSESFGLFTRDLNALREAGYVEMEGDDATHKNRRIKLTQRSVDLIDQLDSLERIDR